MLPDGYRISRLISERVKADPGAQARICAMTGENPTTVNHWASGSAKRLYRWPVDLLPVVVNACDAPELHAAIASENGLDVIPRPRVTASPAPIYENLARCSKALGDVAAEVVAAGADIDASEGERIHAEGERLIATMRAMLARVPRGAS